MTIQFDYTGQTLSAIGTYEGKRLYGVVLAEPLSYPDKYDWTGKTERFAWKDDTLDALSPTQLQEHVERMARTLWNQLKKRDENVVFWATIEQLRKNFDFESEYNLSKSLIEDIEEVFGKAVSDDPRVVELCEFIEGNDNMNTEDTNTNGGCSVDILSLMQANAMHILSQRRDPKSFEPGEDVWVLGTSGYSVAFGNKVRIKEKRTREGSSVCYLVYDPLTDPAQHRQFEVWNSDVTMSDCHYYESWTQHTGKLLGMANDQFRSHVFQGALSNLWGLFNELDASHVAFNENEDPQQEQAYVDKCQRCYDRLKAGFETVFNPENEGQPR